MATEDFFRARFDQVIDQRHPLAVLARRMPWGRIEAALAPSFARQKRVGRALEESDLFGPSRQFAGAGVSVAGRPRLPIRLFQTLPERIGHLPRFKAFSPHPVPVTAARGRVHLLTDKL